MKFYGLICVFFILFFLNIYICLTDNDITTNTIEILIKDNNSTYSKYLQLNFDFFDTGLNDIIFSKYNKFTSTTEFIPYNV